MKPNTVNHIKINSRKEKQDNRRKGIRIWYKNLKRNPCVDCGQTYDPVVMQFDHITGTKVRNISDMVGSGYGKDRILLEISKCDLVCANCHAIRTKSRKIP
jgi:hypothetical protein